MSLLPDWVEELRPAQFDAIEEVLEHFEHGTELVLLDGPTGSGKTLVAEMVRRELDVTGLYVPHTKTLQEQYLDSFDVPKLMGRANYPLDYPGFNLTAADCQGKGCPLCPNGCPYALARSEAVVAQNATLNTSYFLHQINSGSDSFQNRGLVVVDEADELRGELMNYVSVRVSRRILAELGLEEITRGGITKPERWLEWVQDALVKLRAHLKHMPKKSPTDDLRHYRHRTALQRLGQSLTMLSYELEAGGWVYTGKNGVVEFKPVDTTGLAQRYLWNHGERWLLMSATWVSPELEVEKLGWDGPWALVEMPSTFDPARRPVRIVPVADMSKKAREENPDWCTSVVAMLVRIYARHGGEPMLVHSVSYDITKQVVAGLDRAGMPNVWTYTSAEEREKALAGFREHGGVMVAPSMDRGVDFADESCRVVVVLKVPYPDLNDRQISAQMHDGLNGKLWYAMMTVRTVVQMTGRAMRHADDSCTSYVLDSSFVSNLWRRNGSLFPEWWTAAVDWRFQ